MGKYNLKYKTFDQLMAEVRSDFEAFNQEDLIKPHQLIKVAKRVNYDLGLRINQRKNAVLTIENGRAKLPDDFMVLNFMYLLGHHKVTTPVVQGTHVEEVPLDAPTYHPGQASIDVCATPDPCPKPEPECPDPCQAPEPCGCNTCGCDTWLNCKGQEMQLIQKVKMETREWTEFYRVRLINTDEVLYDEMCPNIYWTAKNTAFIRDNYIYTSFREGTLYINYEGIMEKDGCLMVLDHDAINDYYEYAVKDRIIENLMAAGETITQQLERRIVVKLRESRNIANGIVNTPDFAELKAVWLANRKAMYRKYYKMFK